MKDTYKFPSKDKVRNHLYEFVQDSDIPNLRNKKVLTMLGHESSELEQIWDPLGISRGNIITVDNDPEVVRMVNDSNWGVVACGPDDISNYLANTMFSFAVINLDTTSQYGFKQRHALRTIAHRGLLEDKSVLATWYVGNREGGYTRKWFDFLGKSYRQKDEGEMIKKRHNLIGSNIRAIMIDGQTNFAPHPIAQKLGKRYENAIKNSDEFIELAKQGGNPDDFYSTTHMSIGNEFIKSVIHVIAEETGLDKRFSEILYYQGIGSYFTTGTKNLSYVSDKGTPMIVDFNRLEKLDFHRVTSLRFKRGKFSVRMPNPAKATRNNRLLQLFRECRERCYAKKDIARKRVVSEKTRSKPETNLPVSKRTSADFELGDLEIIASFIDDGENSSEIASLFDGKYTWQKIAALKAKMNRD